MAEYVVLNNDESVDYTDDLPDPSSFAYAVHRSTSRVIKSNDLASPTSFSTADIIPTHQGHHGQLLNTHTSGPSSSGTRVATPARLECRQLNNMGNFSDPARLGAPVTTPTRQESRPMPSTVVFYKTRQSDAPVVAPRPLNPREVLWASKFGPPLPAPPRPEPPRQMLNDIPESSRSGTQTRFISPYAQLNKDFGKEGRWRTSSSDTALTSTSTHKELSHLTRDQINANNGGVVATALHEKIAASKTTKALSTLTDQAASDASVGNPSGEKLVFSKPVKVRKALANQEGSDGPVLTPSTQKTPAPKMTKAATTADKEGSGEPVRTPSVKKTIAPKATKAPIVADGDGSSDSVGLPTMNKTALKTAKASRTLANRQSSNTPAHAPSTKKTAVKTTKAAMTLADEQVTGAPVHAPSSKKATTPKSNQVRMSLGDQETSGAPIVPTVGQETAPSKGPNNPPTRKTLTATKPKTAETAKPGAQEPDPVKPKTPKRRPSSSHPNGPTPKIAKIATPPNQSSPANVEKTPIREISRAITLETPKDRGVPKQQPITRWTHHSASSGGVISLEIGGAAARPPIVPEVGSPLAHKTSLIERAPAQQLDAQKAARAESKEYPNFRDGDVLIISPVDNKTWTLHGTILCNASPLLKNIIAKQDAFHIKRREREDGMTVKWKLIMIEEPDARHSDPEGLIFKSFKAVGVLDKKNSLAQFEMPLNVNGLEARPQFNKLYDNFFKCLYNIQPDFASRADDPEAREYILDAHKLVEAATYLEAVPAVRATVEAKLLRLNTVLWKYLESRPESWVHLAARLQSPLMFSEAIIHIVGKFHLRGGIDENLVMDKEGRHGELGRQIWDLIVKKARELKDKKLQIERRLVEFYPTRMLHMETDNSIPGRAIYSEDIYFWQALTLVRQFIASSHMANFHHRASDAGIEFYRLLYSGSYLRPETLDSFYECFAMTLKGKQCLMQVLEMIKGDLKPIVRELLVNQSKGDRGPDAPALDHLTCVEILEEEYPWIVPAVETNGDVEMSGAL